VVKTVKPENVTLVDQSVHQLAVAKKKPELKGVTILEGDAEDLKFLTDTFDRYISAGSIEYWPEPQRGIKEAYRVLKEGGIACMIGPVHPTYWLSRFMADAWMLFPTEAEYVEWFARAGFVDIKIKRIGPSWYRGVRRHGLIIGCSVTGVKPKAGESPLEMGPIQEEIYAPQNPIKVFLRFFLGFAAASYYFFIPVYMYLKHLVWPRSLPGF
jgi:MPBQ/MSBQ methyltransferase